MSKQPAREAVAHATIIACADEQTGEDTTRIMIAEKLAVQPEKVGLQPNVMWLAPERSYGREEVMQVVHELSMTTFDEGAARFVVFTRAHRLTPEAANALLKLIEEPPQEVYFFFLVATVAHMLPTLRSRSQVKAIAGQALQGQPRAQDFLSAGIPARFAQIAALKERSEMLELYEGLLFESAGSHNYDAAEWLLKYAQYARGSGNMRLLLETSAVRIGEVK